MRKTFAAALGAALAAGLAWAALGAGAADRTHTATLSGGDDANARIAARRDAATYKGKFRRSGPGTKITIKVRTNRDGEAKAVKGMTYRRLPATCPESGFNRIGGRWTLNDVKVNDRRKFKAVGGDGDPVHPSTLRFTGRFSENFKRVRGRFQTTVYFPEGDPPEKFPEETCTSETKPYTASR